MFGACTAAMVAMTKNDSGGYGKTRYLALESSIHSSRSEFKRVAKKARTMDLPLPASKADSVPLLGKHSRHAWHAAADTHHGPAPLPKSRQQQKLPSPLSVFKITNSLVLNSPRTLPICTLFFLGSCSI